MCPPVRSTHSRSTLLNATHLTMFVSCQKMISSMLVTVGDQGWRTDSVWSTVTEEICVTVHAHTTHTHKTTTTRSIHNGTHTQIHTHTTHTSHTAHTDRQHTHKNTHSRDTRQHTQNGHRETHRQTAQTIMIVCVCVPCKCQSCVSFTVGPGPESTGQSHLCCYCCMHSYLRR